MTATNYIDRPENIEALNAEIRQALMEVWPVVSPELQLEITLLLEQVHRINHLIHKRSASWITHWFKLNNQHTKFTLLLQEIKDILLTLKSNQISSESIREFRINLEKEINCDRYLFFGYILNMIIHIYYLKSVPFKIFIGLSITTFFSLGVLHLSAKEIYQLDLDLNRQQIEQKALLSTPSKEPLLHEKFSHEKISNPNKLSNSSESLTTVANPNKHVWYSLVYAGVAGILGSVASILLRIIDFRDQKYEDPLIPFFIGLFKPIIGLILGIFAFSLISSGIVIKIDSLINLNDKNSSLITNKARQDLFIFSCAFLIGFSERFASDLLKKSESVLIEK
jgi:hypothetical protein